MNRLLDRVAFGGLAAFSILLALYPVLIMILEAFGIDIGPIFSGRGLRFVGGVPYFSGGLFPTIANLRDAFQINAFPQLVVNSTIIAVVSIGIALAAGIPAGYALARLNLKGRSAVGFLLLILRSVSPFAILLPLFLLYVQTGLWDTLLGMSFVYLVIDLPVVVWVLRGFFADVPKETYEAAEVFGASEKQIFGRIAIPSVALGVVATALFVFVLLWNEFLIASVLTGPSAKTVGVGIWTGVGSAAGFRTLDYDELNTLATLALVPVLTVLFVVKRYLARAFTLGRAA